MEGGEVEETKETQMSNASFRAVDVLGQPKRIEFVRPAQVDGADGNETLQISQITGPLSTTGRAKTKLNQRGQDIPSASLSYQRPSSHKLTESQMAIDHGFSVNITKDSNELDPKTLATQEQLINQVASEYRL